MYILGDFFVKFFNLKLQKVVLIVAFFYAPIYRNGNLQLRK